MLEEVGVLYRGLVLGLMIAAPVGPVGLLCIRRTLQKGMVIGLATGLGAACADAIFGALAVLGVGAIVAFVHRYEASIRLIGGAIVLISAWHTWRDHPEAQPPSELVAKVENLPRENIIFGSIRATTSALVITITNPLTLFGTLAVVATFGGITEKLDAEVMIGGIFIGSISWWCFLTSGISLLRRHFTESRIITVNRITAVFLTILAVWAIISGFRGYIG